MAGESFNRNAQIRRLAARALGKKRLPRNLELDHIIPKWAGGSDRPINLQFLTRRQHLLKTAYENALKARLRKRVR